MAKMYSSYLDREIDVSFKETQVDGEPTTIITHDSLEDVILNQIPDYNVKYDKTLEFCGPDHWVVKCTISDKNGRRVQNFGESINETLYTPIGRTIPAIMAEIRAFDRAAIRYLNLPGKVYSNEEAVEVDLGTTVKTEKAPCETVVDVNNAEESVEDFPDIDDHPASQNAGKPASTSTATETHNVPKDDNYSEIEDYPELDDFPDIPEEDTALDDAANLPPEVTILPDEPATPKPATIVSKPAETEDVAPPAAVVKPNDAKPAGTNSETSYGDTVINFGKYAKAPMTVAEICETAAKDEDENEWVKFACYKMPVTEEWKKTQVKALKTYYEGKGV